MEKTIWVNGAEFILVEAENLSLEDDFMKYKTRTRREYATKELISVAIRKGVKNFYRPKCDPSFTEDGNGICFVPGKKPAVGKSYNWWNSTVRKYSIERHSRLGTSLEYLAFLGVLIKKLIEEGRSVEWAWNAVCNDSCELGHYYNSENAKDDFETTGSRCICDFCDLANTIKVLAENEELDCVCLACGDFCVDSYSGPLAHFVNRTYRIYDDQDYRDIKQVYGVGWVVIEK